MTNQPARAFQKGDRVQYVRRLESWNDALTIGEIYTVSHFSEGDKFLGFAEVKPSWTFNPSRFVLAAPEEAGWEYDERFGGAWHGPGCSYWGDPERHSDGRHYITASSGVCKCGLTFTEVYGRGDIPHTPSPAAGGRPEAAQPSPVKADKADPYAPKHVSGDEHNAWQERNEAARLRNLAALRRDLDSSSAKRRAALGRRFDGRAGIDLEQAWSTPGDES